MGAEASVGGAGVPHEPVGAHEGNELSKRGHDAQQGPQHGAAGDDDMAHGCRRREAVPLSTLLGWMAHSPSGGGGGGGSFSGTDGSPSEHFSGTTEVNKSRLLPTFPSLLLISSSCHFATAVAPPPSTRRPSAVPLLRLLILPGFAFYIVLNLCSPSEPAGVTSDKPETEIREGTG